MYVRVLMNLKLTFYANRILIHRQNANMEVGTFFVYSVWNI